MKSKLVVICIVLLTGFISQLVLADEDMSEGFGSPRLENEYKIHIPLDKVGEIREYLVSEYLINQGRAIDSSFSVSTSQEIFIDTYFDTPDFKALESMGGIRHRMRFVEGKLDKQLIQIKISDLNDSLIREEIKFKVASDDEPKDIISTYSFFKFIREKDREIVISTLSELNINPLDLKSIMDIQQNRTRFYILGANNFTATVTLDEVTSKRLFVKGKFTELELELNEVIYTSSNATERDRMQALNNKIKSNLFDKFPYLVQDQTPKYNKMFNTLQANFPIKFLFKFLIKSV